MFVMAKRKEDGFEKLARLIKEEGEEIRSDLKKEISGVNGTIEQLKRKMDEGFSRIERNRLDETIQPQLDDHARRIKVLETKSLQR